MIQDDSGRVGRLLSLIACGCSCSKDGNESLPSFHTTCRFLGMRSFAFRISGTELASWDRRLMNCMWVMCCKFKRITHKMICHKIIQFIEFIQRIHVQFSSAAMTRIHAWSEKLPQPVTMRWLVQYCSYTFQKTNLSFRLFKTWAYRQSQRETKLHMKGTSELKKWSLRIFHMNWATEKEKLPWGQMEERQKDEPPVVSLINSLQKTYCNFWWGFQPEHSLCVTTKPSPEIDILLYGFHSSPFGGYIYSIRVRFAHMTQYIYTYINISIALHRSTCSFRKDNFTAITRSDLFFKGFFWKTRRAREKKNTALGVNGKEEEEKDEPPLGERTARLLQL